MKNFINIRKKKFGSSEIWTPVPWTKGQLCSHITTKSVVKSEKNTSKVIVQSNQVLAGNSKFKSCRFWSCFLRNFIVAKKSKNVEIVFSIPRAKSGSISIKIRQPLFWTDPYLPDLVVVPTRFNSNSLATHSCYCVFEQGGIRGSTVEEFLTLKELCKV